MDNKIHVECCNFFNEIMNKHDLSYYDLLLMSCSLLIYMSKRNKINTDQFESILDGLKELYKEKKYKI